MVSLEKNDLVRSRKSKEREVTGGSEFIPNYKGVRVAASDNLVVKMAKTNSDKLMRSLFLLLSHTRPLQVPFERVKASFAITPYSYIIF